MSETKENKSRTRIFNHKLSPLIFIASSLFIIFLLVFFVITTLNRTINTNLQRGLEVVYSRFEERERQKAKDSIDQFIMGIKYAVKTSPLPPERLKQEIFDMIAYGTIGLNSANGYFVFDENDICIISLDYPSIIGRSITEFYEVLGIDFRPLVSDLRNGGEPVFFQYMIPSEDEGAAERIKTSYLAYISDYDWILGAGFYTDGADTDLDAQRDMWLSLGQEIKSGVLLRLLVLSSALFFLIIIIVFLLYRSDVSRKKIEKRHRLFEKALEENLCVMHLDPEGLITEVNEKYLKLSGHTREELIGQKFYVDYVTDQIESLKARIRKKLQKSSTWTALVKGQTVNGEEFWLQAQSGEVRDLNGTVLGHIAFGFDVTELHRQKHALEKSFLTDTLTGFGNRVRLLSDYNSSNISFIAMYNIDGFGSINHFYGMSKGDDILIQMSVKLGSLLNQDIESLYRIHSDTFVVMSREQEPEQFINNSRERLAALNEITIEINESRIPISVRCGISVYGEDSLIIADSALAAAKSSSDGFVAYSEKELSKHIVKMENLEKLNNIRMALNKADVYLVFQPIQYLKTGSINKYECLLRMKNPDGSVANPVAFINIAKEGRLYKKLTAFVIEKSFETFSRRDDEFSINLTLEDFMDRETLEFLTQQAEHYQISHKLILEIVETEELKDFDGLIKIISQLKQKGIRIAIDDFGAGFSNFNYLLRLNADFIKIDGSLVKNILTDEKSRSLVASIIQFAGKAGMLTIAEYIEREELLEFATTIGIDYGQGYFIGKPSEDIIKK